MNYYIYINEKSISDNHNRAMHEYIKRLSAYCKVSVNISPSLKLTKDIIKTGHDLLVINRGISTDSSTGFADYINDIQLSGISNLHVIIGYNDHDIYSAVDNDDLYNIILQKSLSASSLNIETSAILFLEQLYRGYTILQGKTYHK